MGQIVKKYVQKIARTTPVTNWTACARMDVLLTISLAATVKSAFVVNLAMHVMKAVLYGANSQCVIGKPECVVRDVLLKTIEGPSVISVSMESTDKHVTRGVPQIAKAQIVKERTVRAFSVASRSSLNPRIVTLVLAVTMVNSVKKDVHQIAKLGVVSKIMDHVSMVAILKTLLEINANVAATENMEQAAWICAQ